MVFIYRSCCKQCWNIHLKPKKCETAKHFLSILELPRKQRVNKFLIMLSLHRVANIIVIFIMCESEINSLLYF